MLIKQCDYNTGVTSWTGPNKEDSVKCACLILENTVWGTEHQATDTNGFSQEGKVVTRPSEVGRVMSLSCIELLFTDVLEP